MIASRSSTSTMPVSQRCSVGRRSGDCGGCGSPVNSLSPSRSQSEMTGALRHVVLPEEVIRRWWTGPGLWRLHDALLVLKEEASQPPSARVKTCCGLTTGRKKRTALVYTNGLVGQSLSDRSPTWELKMNEMKSGEKSLLLTLCKNSSCGAEARGRWRHGGRKLA